MQFAAFLFFLLSIFFQAFSFKQFIKFNLQSKTFQHFSTSGNSDLDGRTRERIETLVTSNKVLLFMKGNKIFPQWFFLFLA
jgi:hypothetical protein